MELLEYGFSPGISGCCRGRQLENHAATLAAANGGCSNEIASLVEDDAG
jgi:hypothetical protein